MGGPLAITPAQRAATGSEEGRGRGDPIIVVQGDAGELQRAGKRMHGIGGRNDSTHRRPLPDGTTHLLFTGLELLRRVASLVPPPRTNLTRFHGVFAPGAKLRPFLVPQAGEKASVALEAATRKEPRRGRTPRVDQAELLRRTFAVEVFACMNCGGRRRVLAYVKAGRGVRAILEHLGLPTAGVSLAPAQELTQAAWC